MNTYIWLIKNLNTDTRGYANTLQLEMEGTNGNKTVSSSISIAFGAEDYKPRIKWSDSDIENYAKNFEEELKNMIDERLEAK
jgi:hypothetical protein